MAPLKAYLQWLGHDVRHWGFGINEGKPERDALRLGAVVAKLHSAGQPRVSLVGWSLGGVIAREIAREHPEAVRRVVTYGTPAIGGPSFTAAARAFGHVECTRAAQLITALDRDRPIVTPITAIYTRRDRVVSWPACIDRVSRNCEHVEAASTHLGLGLDPAVWLAVADALSVK